MKAIKAAAVQAAPVYLNLDASIAKAAEIVSEAARNGAKLVAFSGDLAAGLPFFRVAWRTRRGNSFHTAVSRQQRGTAFERDEAAAKDSRRK
jgi:Carbon-nitrogen hydrolase